MAINNQLNIVTLPFPVFKNVVNIPSSQILTMYTTPVLVVPAPGSNKCIFVHDLVVEYAYGGTPYANGSLFQIQYGNAGSGAGLFIINSGVNVTGSANSFAIDPAFPFTGVDPVSSYVNNGIYASTNGSNYTAGNGTFRVTAFYTIVTTTA